MFKLSKQSDYALVLLSVLAKLPPGEYQGLKNISEEHYLPYKFIGAIATKLRSEGILESKEGSGGGYKLAKDAQDITLEEIITTLEGPIAPVGCMRGKTCICSESCMHQGVFKNLSQILTTSMKKVTLADMVNN